MKCPCCELVIEDERRQVRHVERCHPELIRKRLQEANMDPRILPLTSDCFPSMIEDLMRRCNSSGWKVVTICAPLVTKKVLLLSGKRKFSAEGETLMAALCLAMDRVEYTK
jgi:hypothetical protein